MPTEASLRHFSVSHSFYPASNLKVSTSRTSSSYRPATPSAKLDAPPSEQGYTTTPISTGNSQRRWRQFAHQAARITIWWVLTRLPISLTMPTSKLCWIRRVFSIPTRNCSAAGARRVMNWCRIIADIHTPLEMTLVLPWSKWAI